MATVEIHPMSMSLREQLLAAGLGTKKQAKQADQEQRRQQRNEAAQAAERKREAAAQAAQAAKVARDQELNRRKQEQAQLRARWAQIKQLVETHRLPKIESDDYFNFIDRDKIRRLAVDAQRREQLMSGAVVIVRSEGRYDVVPAEIGTRIGEVNDRAVVKLNAAAPASVSNDDDPYKDYAVPDDLMW
jgi:uncharacterized protein YaiL (DUF2058 family)